MRTARRASGLVLSGRQSPVSYKNLVANGDFSGGTTGWIAQYSTLSSIINLLTISAAGVNASGRAGQSLGRAILGNKYWIKGSVRVTNANCANLYARLCLSTFGGTTINQFTQATPTANTWYPFSQIASGLSGALFFEFIQAYADAATANGKVMEVQQVMAVDLTALFGPGNEPTLAWCDANLPFIASDRVYYKNLVQNGDFANGTTGWGTSGGGTVENGKAKFFGTSTLYLDKAIPISSGKKIYAAYDIEVSRYVSGSLGLRLLKDGVTIAPLYSSTAIGTRRVTSVLTLTDSVNAIWLGNTLTGNADTYIDNLMLVDLTAIFGAGNEPSLAWCDANLPFVASVPANYQNLVVNPDFSGGTTGWTGVDAIVGGVAEKTVTVQYGSISQSLLPIVAYKGHILYAAGTIKADSVQVGLSLTDGVVATAKYHSGSNAFESCSVVKTISNAATVVSIRITDIRAAGWTKFYTYNIFVVDLTAWFGAGNEPTAAWCDTNLPFLASGYGQSLLPAMPGGGLSTLAMNTVNKVATALAMPANLSDRSRFGNHGAFTGATWVQLPTGAWVMDFIGAGRKTTIVASGSLNDLSEFSISFWIKYVNAGTGRSFDKIVKRAYRDSSFMQLVFDHGFSTTGGSWRSPVNSILNNVWKNVQISYDNKLTTNNPTICIDGVSVAVSVGTSPVGIASLDAANALILGNRLEADRDLNGYLSAPKIYNYLRTEAQALAAFNAERYLYGV